MQRNKRYIVYLSHKTSNLSRRAGKRIRILHMKMAPSPLPLCERLRSRGGVLAASLLFKEEEAGGQLEKGGGEEEGG